MYNKVIMIGRLTSTPELHKTNNDKSVARATIAVNRRYKDQNGEREADFVNMVLWGRLAETLASYATKGSLISVDGELRTRRFEKNGQMNYVTEVLVTGFQLLESRAQRAMRENKAGQDLAIPNKHWWSTHLPSLPIIKKWHGFAKMVLNSTSAHRCWAHSPSP